MRTIALTGGAASGKQTVADVISKSSIPLIDARKIGQEVLDQDTTVAAEVTRLFGTTDFNLIQIAMAEKGKLRKTIESLVNKKIARGVMKEMAILKKGAPPPETVVVLIPLLFESGWDSVFDEIIVVISSHTRQIERLHRISGLDPKIGEKLLASQWSDERRREKADFVLKNDGSRDELKHSTISLIEALKAG